MLILDDLQDPRLKDLCPVITIGNFDGVHLGHQKVINQTMTLAKAKGTKSLVMTFAPHTRKLLNFEHPPLLLNTPSQKLELIEKMGMDFLLTVGFTDDFSHTTPEEFVRSFLVDKLRIRAVCLSSKFRFGYQGRGDIHLLKRLGKVHLFEVVEVEAVYIGNRPVDSTRIRELIREGRVEEASLLLGREYMVDGRVTRGVRRGESIGYPTANIQPENELLPGFGIYITRCLLRGNLLPSVTSLGVRPTFGENIPTLETHILNFSQEIYGEPIRLCFIKRIRDEMKFPHPDSLREQIRRDVEAATEYFKKNKPQPSP
ncbi:riboflavin biosynthesis protein RibF [bacterium (candidate division B38) B3_B38]|nr:MAG: riboflavin biosynthesis protein RibF [bacterium (candidate division B38) B3_B38]